MAQRTAEIHFKDQRAGLLKETARGGTRFAYDPAWQRPIACCFPIDRREHEWAAGLHPFFQHLGTEGWLREQQARVAHIDQDDDLGLLLRYGADCIGAVSVHRPAGTPAPAPIAEATASPGRTVSGVQRKLLVTRSADGKAFVPAGPAGPAPFIAKFNSERLPTLVRNERLALAWTAAVLGKREVTEFTVATIETIGEAALVVTRFDRTPDGQKLRLEDCAQILCKPRGADYGGKYDAAYEDVAAIIKAHSVRPAIDLARFFRRLIAFAIIGNCDAHLKNFSLLETPTGLRLSPVYDVVNTAIYDGFDQTLGLSINGAKPSLDAVNHTLLRAFGLSIGVPARAVDQVFTELRRKITAAAPLIAPPAAEPPDGFVNRFSEIVSNACLRILP